MFKLLSSRLLRITIKFTSLFIYYTKKEETVTKLHLLESQRELDEARILAQTEKLERILNLYQEYKARYGSMKKQLHKFQYKNEALEIQVAELEECKKQATELKEHNRFLENKMIEMCKVAEHEEENKRVRMLNQQMEDKHRECELLINENRNLRERITQLDSEIRKQLDNAEHLLTQKEEKLQHQITSNQALRKQLQENTDGLNREIIYHERTIEELSSKAVRRLQRIRMLESQMMIEGTGNETMRLEQQGNAIEIAIQGALLTGALDETKSFILIDFHTFKSEVSDIVSGANPMYDFDVSYEMTESDDAALFRLLAGSFVRVELYVLVREETPPKLLAWASVQTSALLTPLAQARSHTLELLPPNQQGGGEAVGSLNLSMQLARPISMIHAPPRMMDLVAEGAIASRVQRVIPDLITISIASVSISRGRVLYGNDDPFYVQYRFIACDVMTSLECADARGMISFRHTSSFPIISTEEGSLEPVFWALSRVAVYFTLFAGGRRENDMGEWEKGEYRIVGRAQVSLGEAWSRTNATTAEIISPEAKIVGSMAVSIETSAKPTLSGGGDDNASKRRSAAHSRFAALLTEVTSYIGMREDENETVDVTRLLRFIDPPAGIHETAENLRRLLGARRFRCNAPDGCVISSPKLPACRPDDYGDGMTSMSEFVQCTEEARHRGSLPMEFPPDEEMEDIYRHLSRNDGQLRMSDMNYFVASNSVVTLRTTCRKLRQMTGRDVGTDLRGMTDGKREVIATKIGRRELDAYSTELFDCLSDAELIHLSSSLMFDLSR